MTTKEKEELEDKEMQIRLGQMRFSRPSKTSAVVYVLNKDSKSVLLIGDQATGFSGFLYENNTGEIALQGEVKEWLIGMGAILGPSDMPHCHDSVTTDSEWTYFMSCSRIIIPKEIQPQNSAWYSKNSVPTSRIRDDEERKLFIKHVLPQL